MDCDILSTVAEAEQEWHDNMTLEEIEAWIDRAAGGGYSPSIHPHGVPVNGDQEPGDDMEVEEVEVEGVEEQEVEEDAEPHPVMAAFNKYEVRLPAVPAPFAPVTPSRPRPKTLNPKP